jgi:hypothetical protein
MRELSFLFGDRIIWKGRRISKSDFVLWGHIKDTAYRRNPCNLHEMKTSVSNIPAHIATTTQQAVSMNMLFRAGLCKQHADAHIQKFL